MTIKYTEKRLRREWRDAKRGYVQVLNYHTAVLHGLTKAHFLRDPKVESIDTEASTAHKYMVIE